MSFDVVGGAVSAIVNAGNAALGAAEGAISYVANALASGGGDEITAAQTTTNTQAAIETAKATQNMQMAGDDSWTNAAIKNVASTQQAHAIGATVNEAGRVISNSAWGAFTPAVNTVTTFIDNTWQGAVGAISNTVSGLNNIVSSVIDEIRKLLATINAFSGEMLAAIFELFADTFFNALVEAI